MIRKNTIRFVVCLCASLAAAGCGDPSSDDFGSSSNAIRSECEQMCQHGDSCPNLYAESDCVSVCEEAVEDAELLGGTCPSALDEVIACHTRLSCDELTRRAVGSYYNDDCVAKEEAAKRCEPGDPSPPNDELALACEALCNAIDDCPSTFAERDCAEICVEGFDRVDNSLADCSNAIIDTLTCQAGMSCAEIEARVLGRGTADSCDGADSRAEAICVQR